MSNFENQIYTGKVVVPAADRSSWSNSKKILVASEDVSMRKLVAACLRKHNYRIIDLDTPRESAVVAAREQPDLLVLDQHANGDAISEAEKEIIRSVESCKVLLISNNPQICKDCVVSWGGDDFLQRPFSPAILRTTIESML
ncbi:MAG: hypothetical protein QNK37_35890 [Acidobacteriota bacterium]|nr:hypothetical protein [Acidobacteriota bacterium]